jgi:hypothetical protein
MKITRLIILSGLCLFSYLISIVLPAEGDTSIRVKGTVPLINYNVRTANVTDNTVRISWQTNGRTTSEVFFDTRFHWDVADYFFRSPEDGKYLTDHLVSLEGLLPSTLYHFRIRSRCTVEDEEMEAVSADVTFRTLPKAIPPVVTTFGVCPLTPTYAGLWGYLNRMGNVRYVEVYFQFGKTPDYGFETEHYMYFFSLGFFAAAAIPLEPDTIYHYRAVAVGNGISYGQDNIFRTPPLPSITVYSPNGGETWTAGSRQTVRWTYKDLSGNVRIELLNGGVLDQIISSGTRIGSGGRGAFSWAVPSRQKAGSDYKIRIISLSDWTRFDESNSSFSITKK